MPDVELTGPLKQRNWSQVGAGTLRYQGRYQAVFVKRFVDRSGMSRRDHYENERQSHAILAGIGPLPVRIPRLIQAQSENVTLVYEYIDAPPVDRIIRQSYSHLAAEIWTRIASTMCELLDLFGEIELPDCTGGPSPADSPRTLDFNGLEVRNIGLRSPSSAMPQVVFFDPGRAKHRRQEVSGSRLITSALMLNWGRPLTRFSRGPHYALAEELIACLPSQTWSPDELQRQIDREFGYRTGGLPRRGRALSAVESVAMHIFGRPYRRQMLHWVATEAHR